MLNNIFKDYQDRIKRVLEKGTTHTYGLGHTKCTQLETLTMLEGIESLLVSKFNIVGYGKVSGYRVVVNDKKYQQDDKSKIKRPFVYIWKDLSEVNKKRIEKLKLEGLRVYDIRDTSDYKLLKPYFTFELDNVVNVFEKLLKYNDPFSIVEPQYVTRAALEIERMIAISLGEENVFEKVTVTNTKESISKVSSLVQERRSWLNKYIKDDGQQVDVLIKGTNNFVKSLTKET